METLSSSYFTISQVLLNKTIKRNTEAFTCLSTVLFVDPERYKMLEDLCDLMSEGKFQSPDCEVFELEDYQKAIENSVKPYSKKSLLQLGSYTET